MNFRPRTLISALLIGVCPFVALPVAVAVAQTQTAKAPARNNSLFPLVTPEEAQKLASGQPIALDMRNATLSEVLGELQKQSAIPLDLRLEPKALETKFSIDINTPSFYAAFDSIAKASKIPMRLWHFDNNTSPNQLWQVLPDEAKPSYAPRVTQGLFSLGLTKVNRRISSSLDWRLEYAQTRSLEAATAATLPRVDPIGAANELNLTFDARPDPRLPVVGPARVRITRALDEKGRALEPGPPDWRQNNSIYFWINGVWNSPETRATLLPPAPDARKLAHLEGVAIYVFPTARDRWEVPDALNSKERTHEFTSHGQTVRTEIKSIKRNGDDIDLTIEISNDNPDAWGELGTPLFAIVQAAQWMRFEDANGNVLRSRYGNSTNRKKVGDEIRFSPPSQRSSASKITIKPPFKFIFDAPTEWAQTEVPFSFQDVPLP